MKRMKLSVVTRPGGMGDEKCSLKELKISFRHREIASMSAFCSCSPHWMILVPHIHLSHVFILASQRLHAPKCNLLLLCGRSASGIDSSPGSAHITTAFIDVVSCQFIYFLLYMMCLKMAFNSQSIACVLCSLDCSCSYHHEELLFCFPELSNTWSLCDPFLLVIQTQGITAWLVLSDSPHNSSRIAGSDHSTIPGRSNTSLKGWHVTYLNNGTPCHVKP